MIALAASTAAPPARAQPDGDDLRVSIVTFGAGLHPFYKFGHNAFLIEQLGGPGVVYNFGMFNFGSAALLPKFLLGRYQYWLARTDRDRTIPYYIEENRTVQVQELDLTPAQRVALLERLETNALPQNRYYLYDYFYDNCSTRVRDGIDFIIGGRLKAGSQAFATGTYRSHALALTADVPWLYLSLYFALGQGADKPLTTWDEGFIPMLLRDQLRAVRIPGEAGQPDRPLVKSERVLFQSTRADLSETPPNRLPIFAGAGILVGGLFALLGWLARSRGAARIALGVGGATLGFLFGLLGAILVFLWTATDHRVAYANANILQTAPWALGLLVYGIKLARGREVAARKAFWLASTAAAASLLGLLLKLAGLVWQDNLPITAFFLPLWLGLTLGLALYLELRLPLRRSALG